MPSIFPSRLARLLLAGAALALTSGIAGAGPKAYVGNFADNTVSVIDTADGKVVATIPVAQGPHGMAITPDGRTVYVTDDGSSALSVIDTATDHVVKTIEVGKMPNGVALTRDGKLLLVTVYGEDRIAFLDVATQAVVATVGVPKPHTVAISPDGNLAYITFLLVPSVHDRPRCRGREVGTTVRLVLNVRPSCVREFERPREPRDRAVR
jgi:YVTN family beta-propeller protein